jgi:hypothetical protein
LTFVILACECGSVVHYLNDPGPANAAQWKKAMRLLKRSDAGVLVLNLNPGEGTFGRN